MEIKMINSPSTPTSPNADSAPSTVDGRQAEDDYDDETLIAIAVDRRSSNAIAAGEAIARRLTRLRRPIDLDQPPTPLAAGGIIDPPNLGIELDKPEALIAVSGRVVGPTHQGEQVDVEGLRELAAAATLGPWFAEHPRPHSGGLIFVGNRADGRAHGLWAIVHSSGDRLEDLTEDARRREIANAEFIAAANPATVSALVDEVLSLRSAVAVARDQALHEAILAVHNSRFYNRQPDCNYNGVRNAERVLREELGARLDYPAHTCAPVPDWVRS